MTRLSFNFLPNRLVGNRERSAFCPQPTPSGIRFYGVGWVQNAPVSGALAELSFRRLAGAMIVLRLGVRLSDSFVGAVALASFR